MEGTVVLWGVGLRGVYLAQRPNESYASQPIRRSKPSMGELEGRPPLSDCRSRGREMERGRALAKQASHATPKIKSGKGIKSKEDSVKQLQY